MITTAPSEQQLATTSASDDEIDLRQVAGALCRRWPWIAIGGAIGILFTGLELLKAKPVYQGEFQIVLNQSSNQSERLAFSARTLLLQL